MLFYVNTYGSYKLSKTVQFFGLTLYLWDIVCTCHIQLHSMCYHMSKLLIPAAINTPKFCLVTGLWKISLPKPLWRQMECSFYRLKVFRRIFLKNEELAKLCTICAGIQWQKLSVLETVHQSTFATWHSKHTATFASSGSQASRSFCRSSRCCASTSILTRSPTFRPLGDSAYSATQSSSELNHTLSNAINDLQTFRRLSVLSYTKQQWAQSHTVKRYRSCIEYLSTSCLWHTGLTTLLHINRNCKQFSTCCSRVQNVCCVHRGHTNATICHSPGRKYE